MWLSLSFHPAISQSRETFLKREKTSIYYKYKEECSVKTREQGEFETVGSDT